MTVIPFLAFQSSAVHLASVLFARSVIQEVIGQPRDLLPSIFPSIMPTSCSCDVLCFIGCLRYCNFLDFNYLTVCSHPAQ